MSFFGQLKGLISDAVSRVARIDASTNTLQGIDYAHHEIHSGSHYFVANTLALDDTDTAEFLITTPDTDEEFHIKFVTQSTTALNIDFYEGSDRTGANATIPTNNNRRSLNTSNLVVHGTVSGGTTDGDLLAAFAIGAVGGLFTADAGGGSRSEEEIVLARDTKYLLRFTSGDDGNRISNLVSWYEHTPKD